jgi:arabinofuranosyltransferase
MRAPTATSPVAHALRAAPLAVLAAGAWSHRWVTEDAFINFRVVEMTLAGHLLVFNAGERVEAATSPLWLWFLVVLQATAGHVVDLAWLSVLAGLALALAGLAAATRAATLLVAARRPGAWAVPAGALVLAVLPPMWDFATSGLETGLAFAWLGGSFLLLVRRAGAEPTSPASPWYVPVVLGLGPLVRPDLTLFSAAFLVVLAVVSLPAARGRLAALGLAAALPGGYEVFRMAYFASLVPNPALAKEATGADWGRGLAYAGDLAGPYLLVVPAVGLAAWALTSLAGGPAPDRRYAVVAVGPMAAGLLHAVYVVRVGGDFMHGRLLLPALFGVLAPVAVLPVTRRMATALAAVAVTAWAAGCAAALRPPPVPADAATFLVIDERAHWNDLAGDGNAVTLADHAALFAVPPGERARRLAAGVVLESALLGLSSMAAGTDVRVLDRWGLAEVLGSHVERDPALRTGHQKPLPGAYRWAQFPELVAWGEPPAGPDEMAAARRVLDCPAVRELHEATTEPLSPGRLLRHLVRAPARSRLRIPRDARQVTSCDQLPGGNH